MLTRALQANRAHAQTHKHAHTRAHTHAHIRHARTHTRTHPCAHTHARTPHARAHAHMALAGKPRTCAHTHAHTRTHAHTHARTPHPVVLAGQTAVQIPATPSKPRTAVLPSQVRVVCVCEYVHAHVLKCVHAWVGRWLAQGWHCTVSLVVVDKLQCETGQIFLKYQILRYINTHTTHFNTHMPALANNTCHQATLLQRRVPVRHQNQFLLLWRVVVVAALLDLRPEATHLPS